MGRAKRFTGSARTYTHGLLSSSFLGLPYRILDMNHKKELLRSLWVRLIWVEVTYQGHVGQKGSVGCMEAPA